MFTLIRSFFCEEPKRSLEWVRQKDIKTEDGRRSIISSGENLSSSSGPSNIDISTKHKAQFVNKQACNSRCASLNLNGFAAGPKCPKPTDDRLLGLNEDEDVEKWT